MVRDWLQYVPTIFWKHGWSAYSVRSDIKPTILPWIRVHTRHDRRVVYSRIHAKSRNGREWCGPVSYPHGTAKSKSALTRTPTRVLITNCWHKSTILRCTLGKIPDVPDGAGLRIISREASLVVRRALGPKPGQVRTSLGPARWAGAARLTCHTEVDSQKTRFRLLPTREFL